MRAVRKQGVGNFERLTSLARVLLDTNRRDEGRAMLAEIYHPLTKGFDTADLKDAKALLDRYAVNTSLHRAFRDALSETNRHPGSRTAATGD